MHDKKGIWRVPPAVLREGKLLLDQQCWCWGQDIRHPEGNLLLEGGFIRERHPTERDLSRYAQPPVVLWAFGLFFEGLWLLRQDFKVRLAPAETPPDIWTVRDATLIWPTTEDEGERLRERLTRACAWIASYEESIPLTWRTETLRRWDKKSLPAEEMAGRWRHLLVPPPGGG